MKIMTTLLVLVALGGFFTQGLANPLPDPWCDWEGGETVLFVHGSGDPAIIATNETPPENAPNYDGSTALRLEDNSPSGTPHAVIAYLYGLEDGDEVTVGFWRFDETPSGAPSCRIWGHWNDALPGDVEAYNGSAGGSSEYGPGTGWDYVEYTWTVENGHTGLVIEVRTYSNAGDVVWIDNLQISPPEDCSVWTPCVGEVVETVQTSFDALKSLYR